MSQGILNDTAEVVIDSDAIKAQVVIKMIGVMPEHSVESVALKVGRQLDS